MCSAQSSYAAYYTYSYPILMLSFLLPQTGVPELRGVSHRVITTTSSRAGYITTAARARLSPAAPPVPPAQPQRLLRTQHLKLPSPLLLPELPEESAVPGVHAQPQRIPAEQ